MHRPSHFYTPRRQLPLGRRTYIAGILNLTPDSFSDGGEFAAPDAAVHHFHRMVHEGAEIVDVGGESTRPGHVPVAAEDETARVVPFLESIRPYTEVLISVDTWKAGVADAALGAGADMVNDVWGAQRDPDMARVIADHGAGCVLMHNRAAEEAGTGDVVDAVLAFWRRSVDAVVSAGVRDDAIFVDPGLGFGKTYAENWELMRRLPELCAFGLPVLLGASRKSMLAKLLDLESPKARLSGTLATSALAVGAGVDCLRVHDVRENRECADVADHCTRYE